MATGRGVTHLHGQLSPYLQAHQDNPVDWYPWGQEAFDEAKRRNVPVLISIGYHTCHWCHVMARESFEDPDVGALVNATMVAIKVDREEHPDVDQLYLAQAGAFIEQLGWPLTVFTTPDGDTFHAATYLPPEPRGDIPSFSQVVQAVSEAWAHQQDQVRSSAESLRHAIADADRQGKANAAQSPRSTNWSSVVDHLRSQEDPEHGGFGGAPKFPVAPVLRFLLESDDPEARELARRTLRSMATSPLRDAVEGGFFRYATRADWSEPHYERMLYDNAGLLWCYASAGMTEYAEGIVSFLRNQLRVPGGFASAQDSESVVDGVRVEGGYYLADEASRRHLPPPALDDKVLAGWNGLAIWALAQASRMETPGDPLGLAREVAGELLDTHRGEMGLARMSRQGQISPAAATLEDYGGLARGLIELGLVTGEPRWLLAATDLVDGCITTGDIVGFAPPGGGDRLVASMEAVTGDVSEGASPSGLALIAESALLLGQLTGERRYRDAAESALGMYREAVALRPLAFGGLASALAAIDRPERELVVVSDDRENPLVQRAHGFTRPGWLAVAVSRSNARHLADHGFSLFAHRADLDHPAAFVCENGVCALPVTTEPELEALLETAD